MKVTVAVLFCDHLL